MIPQQKRATASAAALRARCASPRSSTGSRSSLGSRPTISWERLCSTAWATRSAKVVVAAGVSTCIDLSVAPEPDPLNAKGRLVAALGNRWRERPRPCYIPPPLPPPLRTACLSELPAENFGTHAAGIWTFWLGLRGFTPWRAARCWVENLPNPVKATSSRFFSASVIESITASTASPASRRPRPLFCATRSTNSCLVTCTPLLLLLTWLGPRQTLTGSAIWLNHAVNAGVLQVLPARRPETAAAI